MQMFISPTGGAFLVWTVTVQLVLCGVYATDNTDKCKLLNVSDTERRILKRLEPLTNRNFSVEDKHGNTTYTYIVQVCGDAGGVPGAGVVQIENMATGKKSTVVGVYNATQVFGGSDWVMLVYKNGEKYDNHCSKEPRTAYIIISCNKKTKGQLAVVLEINDKKEGGCSYMFELDSSAMCPVSESKLSYGSIFLIIGLCLVAVYLIGGFLYQRLIVGAKGMEQFPNYLFWVDVGNLSADGCDFVCRSRNRDQSPPYRSVATEPVVEQPEERDDQLLPM